MFLKILIHGKGKALGFFFVKKLRSKRDFLLLKKQTLGWSSGFFFPVTLVNSLCRSVSAAHILKMICQLSFPVGERKTPSRHLENSWLHMTFYFCRLVTEEETIFSLRKLIYEIKSCLTVEFPKQFFCLPNKASVLYRQRKRREKKKKKNKLGQN